MAGWRDRTDRDFELPSIPRRFQEHAASQDFASVKDNIMLWFLDKRFVLPICGLVVLFGYITLDSVATNRNIQKLESTGYEFAVAEQKLQSAAEMFSAAEQKLHSAEKMFSAAEQRFEAAGEKLSAAERRLQVAEETFSAAEEKLQVAEEKLSTADQKLQSAEESLRAAEKKLQVAGNDGMGMGQTPDPGDRQTNGGTAGRDP